MDIDAEVIGQMPNIAFMTMKEAEKLRKEVDEMHRLLSNEHYVEGETDMAAEDWNMFDSVKRPFHYEGDGDTPCLKAMGSMMYATDEKPIAVYWWGCAFKYLWRWPNKNRIEDLEKTKQCIDYLIDELREEDDG